MSNNGLVARAPNDIIRSVDDLIRLGEHLVRSGLLPRAVSTAEAAAAIILKGREIGIGPMEALGSINVIQGKPTASPQLMLALARRTKELEDIAVVDDGQTCSVTVKRRGQQPLVTRFSMEDAKALGLAMKDNWIKQARTMRQWRALAANLRVTFPDAIAGLYTYEELGADVDSDSNAREPLAADNEFLRDEPRVATGEVIDVVGPSAAPEATPTPVVSSPANGKVRNLAIHIKPAEWNAFLAKVSTDEYYGDKHGKANNYHIVNAIKKLGYAEVTPENANEIKAMLRAHAEQALAEKGK